MQHPLRFPDSFRRRFFLCVTLMVGQWSRQKHPAFLRMSVNNLSF
jgi:hypothetical protein